jgi:hypothetical protein
MNIQQELKKYKKELAILQEEYVKLQIICGRKQRMIDRNLAYEILDHLNESNSITETAKKFDCAPEELFYSIPEWDDCNERLYGLDDYLVYKNRLEGRCHEFDNLKDNLIDNKKMRTPDSDELVAIFTDYKKRRHSLYELADKYDLLIDNLFRLLKEGGLIKSESDAFGYNEFYKEYISETIYNSYNIDTDLKLIDMFYKYKNK